MHRCYDEMFVFLNHNVYKHNEPDLWWKIKRPVLKFAYYLKIFLKFQAFICI